MWDARNGSSRLHGPRLADKLLIMADQSIHLRGVRVHNLKSVDVALPLRRWTVISGVSGAGKSSLAFDTLYAEAQRRYLQSFSAYTRQFLERDRKSTRLNSSHVAI